jgi:choline-sulfatase
MNLHCFVLPLASLCLACAASAAPITWSPAVPTTGKADLIEGDVAIALNCGSHSPTITGGGASGTSTYSFTAADFTNFGPHTFAATAGGPASQVRLTSNVYDPGSIATTGDTGFDNVIKTFADAFGNPAGITAGTLTLTGLDPGAAYQIQVFFNDQRDTADDRVMTYGDGLGNNVNIAGGNPASGVQTSHYGSHAVGGFTAGAATQSLTMATNGFGNVHLTALVVTRSGPPPAPDIPANLTATSGNTQISLDWDDNNQSGFSNFIVRRSTTPGGPYADIPGATPTASNFTDTGLTNGTAYHYVVAAKNILGQISGNSNEASATPASFVPPPPATPANLSITPGNAHLVLTWDPNTQPGFLEFRIKRSTVPGGPFTQIATSTTSSFTNTGLTNGTTYHYVITAVNTDLVESPPSAEQSGTPAVPSTPPNFLFIITDDQDTYSIGAYRRSEPAEPDGAGQPYLVDTPNIDRLAAQGMLFHQARLMGSDIAPVCTSSRTSIMSGKNTWQRTTEVSAATTLPGIFNRGVRDGLPALPHATYRTCKEGNSYPTANAEFTVVNDATKRGNTNSTGSEWHADRGIEHLEHWRANHRPNGKPFLMYLGFSHPHDARNARTNPDLTGRYQCVNTTSPGGISLNPGAPPLPFNHLPVNQSLGIPANFPFHPFNHGHLSVRDEIEAEGIGRYRTEAVVRNEIGRNFACVDWIDRQLGRVLAKLEDPDGDGDPADSVLENTYIIFTSDHGIAIGRHGLQGKQNLYEHSWRVPYIVRGPGIAAGSESNALIYLHDSFPTLCDLAGIDPPATIDNNDGQSFRAVLEGGGDSHREHLYGLYAGGDKPGIRAVTDGRFKLIKYDVADNATQVTQLFDLQENPFELLPEHGVPNLALQPSHTLIRQELEERLMAERREFADPYAFLGDRSLWRFEDGAPGEPATGLADRFPWGNDATAHSANGGTPPLYSATVPAASEFVVGETNALSLDFERDHQNHLLVPDSRELSFGNAPFTIEAWVKLESLPAGNQISSRIPVVAKKAIGAADSQLDYMFLAAAGDLGSASGYDKLALHLGSAVVVSSFAIPDTGWHHISVAFDPVADRVRFTLDDASEIIATTASGTLNSGPLVIGAHFDSAGTVTSSFDGLIDELSITNGFLALAELQPLSAIPSPGLFRVIAFERDAESSTASLTFESDERLLYDIESTADLSETWAKLRSFLGGAPGAAATTVGALPLPDGPRGFFRVRSYPPLRP